MHKNNETKMSAKTSNPRGTVSNDESNMDRFIKESCKSFRECNIKNNARRNSLQKKTLGIESERRIASATMSREERQLREHLRQMNVEKAKNHLVQNLRDTKTKKKTKSNSKTDHVIPIEPYPITFRTQTPSPVDFDKHFDSAGRSYIPGRRRRRQSKEFEDLHLHTGSGSLHHIHEDHSDFEDSPRRRVHSMSHSYKPHDRHHLHPPSTTASPKTSPDLRKRVLNKKTKEGNSSGSSKESLNDSLERLSSLDDLRWVGEPEAIHSVRRPRKTVEEQGIDSEMNKLLIT